MADHVSSTWYQYYDDASRHYYYCNTKDRSSQWEAPVDRCGKAVPFHPCPPSGSSARASSKASSPASDTALVEGLSSILIRSDLAAKTAASSKTSSRGDDAKSAPMKDEVKAAHSSSPPRNKAESSTHSREHQLSKKSVVPKKASRGDVLDREIDDVSDRDYVGMARIYQRERKYRVKAGTINCVLCHKQKCTEVFFPCNHLCVCSDCIMFEQICAESEADPNNCDQFSFCPLCNTVIKLILKHDRGVEEARYWDWVNMSKPSLPVDFLRDFKHSAAIIQKIYIDENIKRSKKERRKSKREIEARTNSCAVS